ncbi:MAG: YihY/virulence factor BrkB family protein [Saprospiraceae bacterium]
MIQYLKKHLWPKQLISTILLWSKTYSIPGFNQVPLYNIVGFIAKELKADDITTRANSVAFNFFLSIFPFVIFVLPLVAQLPFVDNFWESLQSSMDGVFPESARTFIIEIISGIRQDGQYGIQSLGFVLAVFFSSSGMINLMFGFDKSYALSFKSRNYLQKRTIAVGLTLLVAILFILSVAFIILGQEILGALFGDNIFASAGFNVLKWLILLISFYSVITLIYRYGTSLYHPLKLINPGAILATSLSIISSVLFSYFIDNFGRYNEIYGSIGALIVILIWLQINAFVLLAGFELNASIAVNRDLLKHKE